MTALSDGKYDVWQTGLPSLEPILRHGTRGLRRAGRGGASRRGLPSWWMAFSHQTRNSHHLGRCNVRGEGPQGRVKRWHRGLLLPRQNDAPKTGLLLPKVEPRPYSFHRPGSARCQGWKRKATLSGLLQTPLEQSASGSPAWSDGLMRPVTHV